MQPYYQHGGVTIYHGDCREVLPAIEAEAIVTDPVWPNRPPELFPGIDAAILLAEALAVAQVARVAIQVGCDTDPRFLAAVPSRFPFLRVCWLRYACPSYKGRILNTGDVGYVFGEPPAPRKGAMVLPGEVVGIKVDKGMTRLNQPGQVRRGGLDASRMPHPTPRKLSHVKWLVKWFGGASVIDPFAGSGTTLLAAKSLGIPATGIEIEERYCEVAASRLGQEMLALTGPEGA